MNRYKLFAVAGLTLTTIGALAGCGSNGTHSTAKSTAANDTVVSTNNTNHVTTTSGVSGNNSVAVQQNGTGTSNRVSDAAATGHSSPDQIQGNVLTLSVKLSNLTSLPSIQQTTQNSELHSTYGTIGASTWKDTLNPLQITLTSHGSKDVIYVDNSKSLKWLMGWQQSGNYLYLNIGEPAPHMTTTDFGGEAVVINLKTKQVALKQSIGMETQQDEFITPTSLVLQWFFLSGPGNSIVNDYTRITNLATDKSVTLNSTTSKPLGQDPYAIGNRVYFASGSKIYFVDIPVAAWSGRSHKAYELVLRPSVKITS